jgi:hypothetical protein
MPGNTLAELEKFVADCRAAGKRVFFTSRSAMVGRNRCPRYWWLKYCYNGTGLEMIRVNVPKFTGLMTHTGAKLLLEGRSPEYAAAEVCGIFDEEVAKRGLELRATENQAFVAAEQRCLSEAFVWVMHYRVIPELKSRYEILEVEQDDWFLMYEDPKGKFVVICETRGDAVMREKAGDMVGGLYILSWKTAKMWDKRKEKEAITDMQGTSEALATELRLKENVWGAQMAYLFKGKTLEDSYRPGTWVTHSPLCRPWINVTGPVPELAHSFEWSNSQEINPNTGRAVTHRLGKGWRPGFIPDIMPTREWVTMLHEGMVQPEAGDPLQRCHLLTMPYKRSAARKKSWLTQQTCAEIEASEAVMEMERIIGQQNPELTQVALDSMFKQHDHQCNYPGECEMWGICYGGESAQEEAELTGTYIDPFSLYRPRAPHHPGQLIADGGEDGE